jgi:hypothetical protein
LVLEQFFAKLDLGHIVAVVLLIVHIEYLVLVVAKSIITTKIAVVKYMPVNNAYNDGREW